MTSHMFKGRTKIFQVDHPFGTIAADINLGHRIVTPRDEHGKSVTLRKTGAIALVHRNLDSGHMIWWYPRYGAILVSPTENENEYKYISGVPRRRYIYLLRHQIWLLTHNSSLEYALAFTDMNYIKFKEDKRQAIQVLAGGQNG